MKPEIAKLWIEALRSGEYLQGTRSLRTDRSTFCCLGVLCELARVEVNGEWERLGEENQWDESRNEYQWFFHIGVHKLWSYLPKEVVAWAGLQSDNCYVVGDEGFKTTLSMMNDRGKTFAEIAQTIEANMECL
ncbi:MAG: hypothetical protein EOP04_31915 [Proteobacteria bacterium]|nr:MAG: hypothetical protein EOP04_31915 [Pseudomonadota bacterium]